MVLSTKDRDLGPDGYRQALAQQFERYFLIEHHNTPYPHAHVIGFRHQLAHKGELTALRERVVALEQTAEQQRQPQAAMDAAPERRRQAGQDYDLDLS